MPLWYGGCSEDEERERVLPHLLAARPGHLAWEGYGHRREHVNHPGHAGNIPS